MVGQLLKVGLEVGDLEMAVAFRRKSKRQLMTQFLCKGLSLSAETVPSLSDLPMGTSLGGSEDWDCPIMAGFSASL